MKVLKFYKLQASGNDFILIDNRSLKIKSGQLKKIAKEYCRRKLGVGADGLLAIEPSKKALFKMRIFNPDGSEAEMCGNGSRASALWYSLQSKKNKRINPVRDIKQISDSPIVSNGVNFETKAGIIESGVEKDKVKIKLAEPRQLKKDIVLKVSGRRLKANFLNTGVPHAVIFVQGLDKIDVEGIGRAIRFHPKFKPNGTNVNFVELLNDDFIKLRTYERGVEAETLACGTGAVAAALLTAKKLNVGAHFNRKIIKVLTQGKEILKVYFERTAGRFTPLEKGSSLTGFTNVWLEGKAKIVYQGGIYA